MSDQQEQRDLTALQREVALGIEVEVFMKSVAGRYLAAKANTEREEALEAFKSVDPENAKAIRALQNKVAVAEMFLLWTGELVTAGENAATTFIASQD